MIIVIYGVVWHTSLDNQLSCCGCGMTERPLVGYNKQRKNENYDQPVDNEQNEKKID